MAWIDVEFPKGIYSEHFMWFTQILESPRLQDVIIAYILVQRV